MFRTIKYLLLMSIPLAIGSGPTVMGRELPADCAIACEPQRYNGQFTGGYSWGNGTTYFQQDACLKSCRTSKQEAALDRMAKWESINYKPKPMCEWRRLVLRHVRTDMGYVRTIGFCSDGLVRWR